MAIRVIEKTIDVIDNSGEEYLGIAVIHVAAGGGAEALGAPRSPFSSLTRDESALHDAITTLLS